MSRSFFRSLHFFIHSKIEGVYTISTTFSTSNGIRFTHRCNVEIIAQLKLVHIRIDRTTCSNEPTAASRNNAPILVVVLGYT